MSPNLHGLGGVVEAEADLLYFLGLGGGTGRPNLHGLGFGDHAGHLDGEVGGFGEGETLCFTSVGDGEVGP